MTESANPEQRFRDRVVVVQGATGAVGGRLVERLVAAGARLALPVRKGWQVEKVDEALRTAAGDAEAPARLVAEVGPRDGEAAAGFAKGTVDSLGPPDAVISCAGAFGYATVGDEPADLASHLLEANLLAPHTLLRAFVPGMKRRGQGRIVLTGAAIGEPGTNSVPGMAMYYAAKAGLHAFARVLAVELDGLDVRVVAPDVVDTPANRRAMPDDDVPQRVPIDDVCDALLRAAAGELEPVHVLSRRDGGG